jgi:hypothetical protein
MNTVENLKNEIKHVDSSYVVVLHLSNGSTELLDSTEYIERDGIKMLFLKGAERRGKQTMLD